LYFEKFSENKSKASNLVISSMRDFCFLKIVQNSAARKAGGRTSTIQKKVFCKIREDPSHPRSSVS